MVHALMKIAADGDKLSLALIGVFATRMRARQEITRLNGCLLLYRSQVEVCEDWDESLETIIKNSPDIHFYFIEKMDIEK